MKNEEFAKMQKNGSLSLWKPRCPLDKAVLSHIYSDVKQGHTSEICPKCQNAWLINAETKEIALDRLNPIYQRKPLPTLSA